MAARIANPERLMGTIPHNDILRATVDPAHDGVRVTKPPFSVSSLMVATFFCGALGGGFLWCWQLRKLELRRSIPGFAIAFIATFALMLALGYWNSEAGWPVPKHLMRLGQRVPPLGLAYLASRHSRTRLRIASWDLDSAEAPVLPWAILAFLIELAVSVGVVLFFSLSGQDR